MIYGTADATSAEGTRLSVCLRMYNRKQFKMQESWIRIIMNKAGSLHGDPLNLTSKLD